MVKIGKRLNSCPDCQVPKELCYCSRIVTVENQTPVTIIMHQRERFLTSNTAVVAVRALKDSEILLRGMRDQSASKDIHFRPGHVPLVLYPSEGALPIGSEELKDYLAGRPAQLIVPDGSWRQAKRVAKREEALKNVQAVTLSKAAPSLYRLRRQVKDGRLCTFEAIARALGDLESLELEKDLMKTLAAMDHAHAMARGMDKFDDGNPDPLTQRLFLGFRVGTRPNTVIQLESKYSKFDWVHQSNDHLNLCFMGRLRRSQKEIIINALKNFEFNKFEIEFSSVEAFDSWGNPSVIWLKPKASEYLLQVQNELAAIIDRLGIPLPEREFIPHWTLLRTRGHKITNEEQLEFKSAEVYSRVSVDKIILFEGHAGKGFYQERLIIDAK